MTLTNYRETLAFHEGVCFQSGYAESKEAYPQAPPPMFPDHLVPPEYCKPQPLRDHDGRYRIEWRYEFRITAAEITAIVQGRLAKSA